MSVIVSDIKIRENSSGEAFIALELSGGLEFTRSQQTGKFYATTRKCSIPSTLTEEVARQMIGTKMVGEIVKVSCDPYGFITDTGEEIELDFRYEYQDTSDNLAETVYTDEMEQSS